jgi:hypothetical protein
MVKQAINIFSLIYDVTLSLASIIHKIDNVAITKGNNEVQEPHLNTSYNSHADIKLCFIPTDANAKHIYLLEYGFSKTLTNCGSKSTYGDYNVMLQLNVSK